jgi:hypothetical protein
MNTDSMDTRKVKPGGMERPGDFCFSDDFETLYIWIPGVTGPDAISIQKGRPGGPRIWGWDGDTEKPTLEPSILTPGTWHGYLKAGRLVSC